MNSVRHVIQSGFRAVTPMISCLSAIVLLFFSGYWLGWKMTAAETPPDQALDMPTAGPVAASATSRRQDIPAQRATQPGVHDAREQAASLARLMHADPTRARLEIASFSIDQTRSTLGALEHAPETRVLGRLRSRLLERWTSLEPRAAFDYARSRSSNLELAPLTEPVLRRWAFTDPVAALQAWRELGLSNGDRYTRDYSDFQGLRDIFSGLGRQNLSLALAEIQSLTPGQQTIAWAPIAGLAAREEHRDQVLSAISNQPPGEPRRQALMTALIAWERTEPQGEPEREALRQWFEWAQFDREDAAGIEESRASMRLTKTGGLSRTAWWRARRLRRNVPCGWSKWCACGCMMIPWQPVSGSWIKDWMKTPRAP
jgi:hypothetical protein